MNKHRPCLLIFAEDEAIYRVVNGFLASDCSINQQRVQVMNYGTGWKSIYDRLEYFNKELRTYPEVNIAVFIDMDEDETRENLFMAGVKEDLRSRFFVVGALHNIERLKNCIGFKGLNEDFGKLLAAGCGAKEEKGNPWSCEELAISRTQIMSLQAAIRPFFRRNV